MEYITPIWPAPPAIRAITTLRGNGIPIPQGYGDFNLASHVGDEPENVAQNRDILNKELHLLQAPCWLEQVHGTKVCLLTQTTDTATPIQADACLSFEPNLACVILTADCLPLLVTTKSGDFVGAIHAGWKGLLQGIIEHTLHIVLEKGINIRDLLFCLGPAIGPNAFVVGESVYAAFIEEHVANTNSFRDISSGSHEKKWLANIYQLAINRLERLGCSRAQIYGGNFCSFSDSRFYSYRRDSQTGRMASMIWMQSR